MSAPHRSSAVDGIAIVGMAGRFPGANDLDTFWNNLKNGVESVSFFTEAELEAAGIDRAVLQSPHYVKAGAPMDHIDWFDASFFGLSPREAELIDPQHRVFLECAWTALEHAGYDPATYNGLIGIYAGAGVNAYATRHLSANPTHIPTQIASDKDFLTTRVSYKLNLKGPSVTVQTACSTSLVAVHLACQGLQTYQCDMALAGGVSITFTQKMGYEYQPEGIFSPDGHCRPFDTQSQGTVSGDGMGIVVLKRLEDAIADHDCIHAVIIGSAINNDGAVKVGYTAPSVDGQSGVIALAQAVAGINPTDITCVEAHGTGTALGDPIEIAALNHVFRAQTQQRGFCAIGSLKSNIGHLHAAAGIAGLIKTVLMLKHRLLLPSLHFTAPNPAIDFATSPFFVNTTLSHWETAALPRRAAVSSFGIGGTNAHVILEEADMAWHPPCVQSARSPWQLLLLSARTETALETATANLANDLAATPYHDLADVAHTLQVGRRAFAHRRVAVCRDLPDAITTLRQLDPRYVTSGTRTLADDVLDDVVFLFPGQGAQYEHMAWALYQCEPGFRAQVDHCVDLLQPHLGLDLRHVLYPNRQSPSDGTRSGPHTPSLRQTAMAQPGLFVIEYALAQLLMSWGVRPQAMMGHSIGEYTAACLAGVFSLEAGLQLVAARGRLMQQLPEGAMLGVPLSERELGRFMRDGLSLAAVNTPSRCVISGTVDAVAALQRELANQGLPSRRLHTAHAFHSSMMAPILEAFRNEVERIDLQAPQRPYVSNLTGTWMRAADALDPDYWVQHLRHPVRFATGLETLFQEPKRLLLEVGPGRTLTTLAQQHPERGQQRVLLTSLPDAQQDQSDDAFLRHSLGKLWLAGVQLDWPSLHGQGQRYRLPLPTYPFERQRYWLEPRCEPRSGAVATSLDAPSQRKNPTVEDWFYMPSWKRSVVAALLPSDAARSGPNQPPGSWLLFVNTHELGGQLASRLRQKGLVVITVTAGTSFAQVDAYTYVLDPTCGDDYNTLMTTLQDQGQRPHTIVHLWTLTPDDDAANGNGADDALEELDRMQAMGFYSLLWLARALGRDQAMTPCHIAVVSNQLHSVTGEESLCPAKATLMGPVRVIPQEYPHLKCRSIDLAVPYGTAQTAAKLVNQLMAELQTTSAAQIIAYRGRHRWVETFEPVRLDGTLEGNQRLFPFDPTLADAAPSSTPRLRQHGVYLITGGLGGLGFVCAEYLAREVRAKLVLIGRTALPARDEWAHWLASHGEEDGVSVRIRRLQELEAGGAEVLYVRADVAHAPEIHAVISQIQAQFGQLHGVIHAAGVPGGGVMQRKTPPEAAQILAPKVKGTVILAAALKAVRLDFFVLFSSLASVQGSFGQVDYTAANAFLDAFAQHKAAAGDGTTICINWDTWQDVGMAATPAASAELETWRVANLRRGILPKEGRQAFNYILRSTLPQILVSTYDLTQRLQQMDLLRQVQTSGRGHVAKPVHPRPDLSSTYVEPSNEIEHMLADIWQELLGIEQIGRQDNFFELGGDSLLAVLVNTRLHETFHVHITVQDLFDHPTIAELVPRLQAADQAHMEAIEQKLDLIEQLSDEEVKQLLAELKPSP